MLTQRIHEWPTRYSSNIPTTATLISIVLAYLFLSTSFVKAEWYLKEEHNVFSGETKQTATTKNNLEQTLTIYKNQATNEIWINFALPESATDYINPKYPPAIKIDDQQWIKPIFEWYPKWFNLLLQSPERLKSKNLLELILKGHDITIKYHSATGEDLESSFSLKNSADLIRVTIGK
ncbi:MAG: hypothetical protein OEM02_02010 [Desulfobulbaceae bacterium]|nr:hypothetical protein [Desulfobulbaceae bacterium]